jgi:FixJ family two-component response regulator
VRPPVILISGHADVHMSVQAMKSGAFEFLTKPIRPQELLDAIQLAISLPAPGSAAIDAAE